jgi:hypothetical protein
MAKGIAGTTTRKPFQPSLLEDRTIATILLSDSDLDGNIEVKIGSFFDLEFTCSSSAVLRFFEERLHVRLLLPLTVIVDKMGRRVTVSAEGKTWQINGEDMMGLLAGLARLKSK